MKRVKVTIEGVTPLLMNKFTDEEAIKATESTRTVRSGGTSLTPREEAEKKLYISEKTGKIIIPSPNLFICIIEGGRFFKVNNNKVTTQTRSFVPACFSIVETEIPLKYKEPWRVDTRPVRIPKTGGRILRHRPCFDEWSLTFNFELDESIIGIRLIRDIIDAAGMKVGLGDYRPDSRGPYGRFKVVLWKVDK